MSVCQSAYGKLFIAGEYAVVAGSPAILVAVDRQLFVTAAAASSGSVYSSQRPGLTLAYEGHGATLQVVGEDVYPYVTAALAMAEQYLAALGLELVPLALQVDSQLDDAETGTKYGLGSSGAVTVATIKAVLSYYGQALQPDRVYKLAVLAQLALGSQGSFGDLAAATYGGWLAYQKFDAAWLHEAQATLALPDLLALDWPGLWIKPLQLPETLQLLIGWTGSAVSTEQLVQRVAAQYHQADKAAYHAQFVADSRACVTELIAAFESQDVTGITQGLQINRQLLQAFGEVMGLTIETVALRQLCEVAMLQGAVAKTSGAGGGDCGFALVTSANQAADIVRAWEKLGIKRLDFKVAASQGGTHA